MHSIASFIDVSVDLSDLTTQQLDSILKSFQLLSFQKLQNMEPVESVRARPVQTPQVPCFASFEGAAADMTSKSNQVRSHLSNMSEMSTIIQSCSHTIMHLATCFVESSDLT